jgi:tRNA G18 (ribose-2'-O)-methylase SpoU
MPALHLMLDNWRSLFNTGSVFRTADGAGVRHVHLCGITPTPAQRKLAKTALGAETTVAWSYAPNAVRRAEELQAQGMQLWVLEGGAGSEPLWTCSPPVDRPLVLAAGNEVVGVDPGLVALAERVVHVPMLGGKESLNVAIALSVAVYWLIVQTAAAER